MQPPPRGFTLIETAVATGILAVAALAIATLFVTSVRINAETHERMNAAVALADKLEELLETTPQNGTHSDSITMPDGSVLMREWSADGEKVTVAVFNAAHRELLRVDTSVAKSW